MATDSMSITWTLERPIEATTWHVAGQFVEPDDRTELVALLVCIVEHGGCVTEPEIGAHLLGPGRTVVARRLLGVLQERGVVDETPEGWVLTESGIDALANRTVSRTQWGIREVLLVDDGLIGRRALRVGRRDREDLWSVVSEPATQPPEPERSLPGLPSITLDGLPSGLEVQGELDGSVCLRTTSGRLEIRSSDPAAPILSIGDEAHSVLISGETVALLQAAVDSAVNSRLDGQGRCPISASQVKALEPGSLESGRIAIRASIAIDGVDGDLKLQASPFPIVAADQQAADAWLEVLVSRRIRGYLGRDGWSELVDEAMKLVESGDLQPAEPTREDVLASGATDRAGLLWSLQAPIDWGL